MKRGVNSPQMMRHDSKERFSTMRIAAQIDAPYSVRHLFTSLLFTVCNVCSYCKCKNAFYNHIEAVWKLVVLWLIRHYQALARRRLSGNTG